MKPIKSSMSRRSSQGSESRQLQFGREDSASTASSHESKPHSPRRSVSQENFWNVRMRHQERAAVVQPTGPICMNHLISRLFTVTLERCLESLVVLRQMYGMSYVDVNLEYVPLSEKYENMEYELQNPLSSQLSYISFQKMKKDLSWMEKILFTTIVNIRKSWNYNHLMKILNDMQMMEEEEHILLSAKKFNQVELMKLRRIQQNEKNQFLNLIHRTTKQLGEFKDELNDSLAEYDVKIKYLNKWENARYEQNKMVLKRKEDVHNNQKETMAIATLREDRVHEEVTSFLSETVDDYHEQIEKWMDRYDAETEDLEIAIHKLKMKMEAQKDELDNLTEQYAAREVFIEEFKREKLRKQLEAMEVAKIVNAATKIQAWWRGVMVRNKLGPWRPQKRKGKKGASKKKK